MQRTSGRRLGDRLRSHAITLEFVSLADLFTWTIDGTVGRSAMPAVRHHILGANRYDVVATSPSARDLVGWAVAVDEPARRDRPDQCCYAWVTTRPSLCAGYVQVSITDFSNNPIPFTYALDEPQPGITYNFTEPQAPAHNLKVTSFYLLHDADPARDGWRQALQPRAHRLRGGPHSGSRLAVGFGDRRAGLAPTSRKRRKVVNGQCHSCFNWGILN